MTQKNLQAPSALKETAFAIEFAHQNGVLHCDLKPSNLLVGDDGRMVVTDFGFAISRQDAGDGRALGGTPGFCAPEVWQGGSPTPAADVYSLGKVGEFLLRQAEPTRQGELLGSALSKLCQACSERRADDRPSLSEAIRGFASILELQENREANAQQKSPRSF